MTYAGDSIVGGLVDVDADGSIDVQILTDEEFVESSAPRPTVTLEPPMLLAKTKYSMERPTVARPAIAVPPVLLSMMPPGAPPVTELLPVPPDVYQHRSLDHLLLDPAVRATLPRLTAAGYGDRLPPGAYSKVCHLEDEPDVVIKPSFLKTIHPLVRVGGPDRRRRERT